MSPRGYIGRTVGRKHNFLLEGKGEGIVFWHFHMTRYNPASYLMATGTPEVKCEHTFGWKGQKHLPMGDTLVGTPHFLRFPPSKWGEMNITHLWYDTPFRVKMLKIFGVPGETGILCESTIPSYPNNSLLFSMFEWVLRTMKTPHLKP